MVSIDLGNVYLPDCFIDMVNTHKKFMIENNPGNHDIENSDFKFFFMDFMYKNYLRMKVDYE